MSSVIDSMSSERLAGTGSHQTQRGDAVFFVTNTTETQTTTVPSHGARSILKSWMVWLMVERT